MHMLLDLYRTHGNQAKGLKRCPLDGVLSICPLSLGPAMGEVSLFTERNSKFHSEQISFMPLVARDNPLKYFPLL